MKSVRLGALVVLSSVAFATPVFADVTGFIGANTTQANRTTRGFALGARLLVLGFEFEYANTPDDPQTEAPALRTGMGNVLLQMPFPIFWIQAYVTTGGGIYRETLGTNIQTGFALNNGGGLKISPVGPLRLRVDYRVFKLGRGALHSPAHRVYAGVNLTF